MEPDIITEEENKDLFTEKEELVSAVREKHSTSKPQEKATDIFTMQLTLTILLVLIFTIVNIFDTALSHWFIDKFKTMTMGETEEIIIDAVSYAERLIK